MLRLPAAILAAALACAAARAQSTIELRAAALCDAGAPILLRDVARLHGEDADVYASAIIAEHATKRSIGIRDVREALEAGRIHDPAVQPPAHVPWGRIALRGWTCEIRLAPAAQASDAAPGPDEPAGSPETAPVGEATVRDLVAAKIAAIAQCPAPDLRLGFDAADADLLGQPVRGRSVQVRPVGFSDRLPLSIAIYEGERLISTRTIRVGVLVRREVAVANAAKRRGEIVAESDITAEQRWLGLRMRPAPPEAAVGLAVHTRLTPGGVILETDLRAPIVISKGDVVSVHCISGPVVLKTMARALDDARDGEQFQVQALDSKRMFTGRASGPGRIVIDAGRGPGEEGA